jgi:hypothetical protein
VFSAAFLIFNLYCCYTSGVSCINGPVLHNCVNHFIVRASHVELLFLFMSAVLLQFVVLIQIVGPSAHAWPMNIDDVTHATSILGKAAVSVPRNKSDRLRSCWRVLHADWKRNCNPVKWVPWCNKGTRELGGEFILQLLLRVALYEYYPATVNLKSSAIREHRKNA